MASYYVKIKINLAYNVKLKADVSQSYSTSSHRAPCTRTATNSLRGRPRPLSGRGGGGGEANARSPRSKKSSPFNLVNSSPVLGGQTISVRGIVRRVSWSHFASHQVFHSLRRRHHVHARHTGQAGRPERGLAHGAHAHRLPRRRIHAAQQGCHIMSLLGSYNMTSVVGTKFKD